MALQPANLQQDGTPPARTRRVIRTHSWLREDGSVAFGHRKYSNGRWSYPHPAPGGHCAEHGPVENGRRVCHRKPAEADRLLWGMPRLAKVRANSGDILWTAGEKDAEAVTAALAEAGVPEDAAVATSVHQGEGHPITNGQLALLDGFAGKVILYFDRDLTGVPDVLARAASLREREIRYVIKTFADKPIVPKGELPNDISDYLAAGGELAACREVSEAELTAALGAASPTGTRGRTRRADVSHAGPTEDTADDDAGEQLAAFLAALRAANPDLRERRAGDRTYYTCPLPDHEDRNPSFNVRPRDSGGLLLVCSCPGGGASGDEHSEWVEAVLDALGLEWDAVSPPEGSEMPAGKGGKRRKPRADNQSKILLDILRARFDLVRDENGELYGIDRQAPAHVAIPALERGGGLRGALAAAFHEKKGTVPSQNALASVATLIEIAAAQAPQVTLPLRTARASDGTIWIDVGDDTGRAVRVVPGQWTIEPRSPFPFRRTTATRPLRVDKSAPADIEPFRALFNLSDGQWDFLLNWMIICYAPGIPHAVPVILGGPGRAKTTLCQMVLEVTDPSHGALSGVSLNEKDLRTHAQGSWVIGLENVSHISREISDFLSRLVTGHQSRERLYYSNSEIKIVALGRRVIIMNGIAITGIRQDLQDRAVNIHPKPISREDRRTDAEIREEFEAAVPGAISYILDSLAAAMIRERDGLDQLDELPRMADFAQWLAYLDKVRETGTLEGFTDTVRRDAIQSALESPIGAALREWLTLHRKHSADQHGDGEDQHKHLPHAPGAPGHEHQKDGSIRYWRMPASQWLTNLPQPDTLDGRRDWPSTAKGFANQMRLIENGLYLDGWTVREHVKDGRTVWDIGSPRSDGT